MKNIEEIVEDAKMVLGTLAFFGLAAVFGTCNEIYEQCRHLKFHLKK